MLRTHKILIADDDETLCYLLKEELINEGFIVDIVYDGTSALGKLKTTNYDLLLLDLEMREYSGEQVLTEISAYFPELLVIILTAKSEMRTAIDCIKLGAYDFITKPYEFNQLLRIIEKALTNKDVFLNNKLFDTSYDISSTEKIIGESQSLKEILKFAEKASKSDSNILLEGETGTGKELFAEFIHKNSFRNNRPFVAINCASLPDQLIESELFGYEKGAFTDAKTSKQGLVEIANGGTLFLDEIGEMSLQLQPKLLRFLENGEFRRIGGINTLSSNVRIIAATNRNLMDESEKRNFRRDLLFRLNVITLTLPPLRNRGKDIILLAEFFLKKRNTSASKKTLSEDAKHSLMHYQYPGNIRELHHIIERAFIFSDTDIIFAKDLNLPKSQLKETNIFFDESGDLVGLEEIEKNHILSALIHFEWNRENTARALGISQKTLYTKILKYDLRR